MKLIKLSNNSDIPGNTTLYKTAGWGRNYPGVEIKLRELNLTIIADSDCAKKYKKRWKNGFPITQFCILLKTSDLEKVNEFSIYYYYYSCLPGSNVIQLVYKILFLITSICPLLNTYIQSIFNNSFVSNVFFFQFMPFPSSFTSSSLVYIYSLNSSHFRRGPSFHSLPYTVYSFFAFSPTKIFIPLPRFQI